MRQVDKVILYLARLDTSKTTSQITLATGVNKSVVSRLAKFGVLHQTKATKRNVQSMWCLSYVGYSLYNKLIRQVSAIDYTLYRVFGRLPQKLKRKPCDR